MPGKVLVIYGARRVGKTTLVKKYIEQINNKYLYVTGDDLKVKEYLSSQSIEKLKAFVGKTNVLIIDEAQYIPKIGLNLKLLVDNINNLKIIATGSSSLELAKDVGEPLTGRKFTLKQFAIAQIELSEFESIYKTDENLESRLIYGSYPEVITANDNVFRENYLKELVGSYLFKDILQLEDIRNPDKLTRLLQLLAFQIGQESSLQELGSQLSISKNTVDKYISLLEKVFIIYHRDGFSRNLRNEISKTKRYYFFDNGIRNALIQNFNPISIRNDIGMLWENYIMSERTKAREYLLKTCNSYFWRTYKKEEIDLIEEYAGKLNAFEIKWKNKKVKEPSSWKKSYPESTFKIIHSENYLDFIGTPLT
ncbi:MAG: ATP-binding protein [Chitinispirillia bacterium]